METMEEVIDGRVRCFGDANYHIVSNQHDELWLLLAFYSYKMLKKVGISFKDSF